MQKLDLKKVDKELEELAKTKLEKTLEKANEPNLNKMKYKHTVELQKIMEKRQDDLEQYERDVEYEGKKEEERRRRRK